MKKLHFLLSFAFVLILGTLKAQIATDSLLYPLDNNTGNGTLFNFVTGDISEVGQYFTVPANQQGAQVTGVIILFGSKSQIGTSDVYSISMYNAGVDSLPAGSAIGTTTFTTSGIDTISTVNTFNFANPINVSNNRFVIGVEIAAPAKNDTNNVLSNTQGDGLGLRRSLVKLNNNATVWQTFVNTWQKLEDVFFFPGTTDPINVDFIILPIYRYPKNPFAQFTASSTNVAVGQTVNLNNTSTGTPTPVFSWSITPTTFAYIGGTNAASINPIVQFSAPGTYTVALTATNSNGSDVQNRVNYIVVSGSGGSVNPCDTVFNFGINDTLRIFTIPEPPQSVGGFQAGHNGFGDISKADKFILPFPNTELRGASLFFGVAKASTPAKIIKVRVWNNTGFDGDGNPGAPGSILAEQNVAISSIPLGGAPLNITFNPPIILTTDYFIGISFTYAAGDTVALFLNDDGETLPGTAYEEWGPASIPPLWYPFFSASSWQTNQSHFILADICVACNISFNAVTINNNTSCAVPNGSIFVTSNGGTTPKQYSIDGGATFQATPNFSGLPAGVYNVVCEDADGCSIDTVITLMDNLNLPTLSSNSIDDNQSCVSPFDGSFNLNIAQGTAPYTYSITGPNSFTQNGQATTAGNVLFSALNGGTYNITVLDASSCSEVISIIVPNNAPTISVSQISVVPNTACGAGNGGFVVDAGSGSFTYAITGQSNIDGIFTGLAANTYSVTATSTSTGCVGTLNVVVPENAFTLNLTVVNSFDNTSCVAPYNGTFEIISNNGQAPFNYSIAGSSNSNGIFNGLEANNYSVTVNDANGCTGSSTVIISDAALTLDVITVSDVPNTACVNPYNGEVSFTTTNGTSPFNYELNGQFNTTGTFQNLNSGNVTVIVRDANGCEGTNSFTIDDQTNNPDVTVNSVAPNAACAAPFDGSFSLSASGTGSAFVFEIPGEQNSTGVFNNLASGQYDVTVTDAGGCNTVETVTVSNNAPSLSLQVSANTNNTSCDGNGNGSFTIVATGGTAPYSFNTGSALNQTGTFNGLAGGTFNVTVTDANGCEGNTSIVVTNLPATLTLSSTTQNASTSSSTDGAASVSASGGTPPYTYNWSNGATTDNINNVAWGDYDVTVTDANGCSATETLTVSFSVGIDQTVLASEIKVYPNPSTGIVSIEIQLNESKTILLDAYNILGENVLKSEPVSTLKFSEKLNFEHLSNGVYLIKIQIGTESIMKRIFVSHL